MSTLSELIPSGGTQNNIEFVAQGTLANGQTVALRSDGKVEAIAIVPQVIGSPSEFESSIPAPDFADVIACAFDASSNKIVVVYSDTNNNYQGTARVGTVSGESISFGSAAVFETGMTRYVSISYNAAASKMVIAYQDTANSSYGKAVVATVSGTSVSFGTIVVFQSSNSMYVQSCYDSANEKTVVGYRNVSDSNKASCIVGTVSGTSISFGSYYSLSGSYGDGVRLAYDTNAGKFVMVYYDPASSDHGKAVVGTVSGTSISFGSIVTVESSEVRYPDITYDSTAQKVVIVLRGGNVGKAFVGTVSGTSISFGATATFYATAANYNSVTYDSTGNKIVVSFAAGSSSENGAIAIGTVSGTSISFTASEIFRGGSTTTLHSSSFDSNANRVVLAYADSNGGGIANVIKLASTNVSTFIGITNAAISSSATGEVAVKGGLSTGGNLLPYSLSFGTAATFDGGTIYQRAVAFDSNSNKVVIAYRDNSNSDYGTAIVGTVSGTAISFGSEVVFEAADSRYTTAVFDSNSNKVVIGYSDYGNSQYGTAIVGTVSGTSISFGTPVIYESAASRYQASTFDTSSNKVVIAYQDNGNSNYGTAVVGTVSGTSVSFGSPVVYEAGDVQGQGAGFDSTNNKVVIAYRDGGNSGYGTAIVGTVSGTSISFGTAVVFEAANSNGASVTYDSTAQKIVISYTDNGASTANAIVGTVSGTSISFGSPVVFSASSIYGSSVIYDTSQNKIVISYGSVSSGKSLAGTVNGTTISFGTATTFSAAATGEVSAVYDSSTNKTVTTFALTTGYAGKAIVGSLTNALTPNTAYFVQDDGSLATTSSSTKAGKAISTTALNLVDPT